MGRRDGAWWFLGALVITGRTRLRLGDFTTRLDFAGSTPSYENHFNQESISLKGQLTFVSLGCCGL